MFGNANSVSSSMSDSHKITYMTMSVFYLEPPALMYHTNPTRCVVPCRVWTPVVRNEDSADSV